MKMVDPVLTLYVKVRDPEPIFSGEMINIFLVSSQEIMFMKIQITKETGHAFVFF